MQCGKIDPGIAKRHCAASQSVQHPSRHDDHVAGFDLDMHEHSRGPLFAVETPNSATMERVPSVVDFDRRPDMGRMTAQPPSGAAVGSSPIHRASPRQALTSAASSRRSPRSFETVLSWGQKYRRWRRHRNWCARRSELMKTDAPRR